MVVVLHRTISLSSRKGLPLLGESRPTYLHKIDIDGEWVKLLQIPIEGAAVEGSIRCVTDNGCAARGELIHKVHDDNLV